MRNHDGQKLQDDRGADVGHNAQGEYRQLAESAAGEHVKEPEKSPLGCLEECRQGFGIDAGRRDVSSNPIDRKEGQRHENAAFELRNPGDILESS